MKTERSISAKELKETFNATSLMRAITELANRLNGRKWTLRGETFAFSGISWEKDRVSFFRSWSAGENRAGYHWAHTTIEDAMDQVTGALDSIVSRSVRSA
jgi:hypothetical protein